MLLIFTDFYFQLCKLFKPLVSGAIIINFALKQYSLDIFGREVIN